MAPKRGPPKEPTVLKLLKGNPGKRVLNMREPKAPPVATMPAPPAYLPAMALKLWKELVPKLQTMRVLTEADLLALEILCNSYAEYREADELIQELGITYESSTVTGATKLAKRPEIEIRADAHRRLLRLIQEFGLTPSARSGVETPPKEPKDPFAEYMGRTGAGA